MASTSRPSGLHRQIPFVLVLAGLIGSAAILIPDQFGYRAACTGLTITCSLAAAMRAVLPTEHVGVLAVRSRALDVALLIVVATVLAVLAFSVPLPGA